MNNDTLNYICENVNNDIPKTINHILTYLSEESLILYSVGSEMDIELITCEFLNVYGTVEEYMYTPCDKKFIPSEEFEEYIKFMRL